MTGPLDDETAIVTGASSGIGRATARELAREGANLAIAARREKRLEELAGELRDEHGAKIEVVPTDVTDEDAVEALVDRTVDAFGSLELLVNNAGTAAGSSVGEMTTDDYETMMGVNCDGMFYAARAALPHLEDAGGQIVFLASFAGKYPRPYNPVYAATKWWTRGFAKSLAAEVGEDVAVSIVNPAAVRTEFEVDGQRFKDHFEPGEVVEPTEVAEAIAYIAKQDPSMVHELDIYNRDKFVGF